MADAFLGPKPPGALVKHRNGDRRDNRAANLAYMAPDAANHHDVLVGCRRTALTVVDVVRIRDMAAVGTPAAEIAEVHGVSRSHVYEIVKRRRWAWVPDGGDGSDARPVTIPDAGPV